MTASDHVHPHVAAVERMLDGCVDPATLSVPEALERQAQRLLQAHGERHPGAGVLMRGARRAWAARPPEELLAEPLTIDEARDAVARDHGFADWDQAQREEGRLDPRFEDAVDAVVTGNLEGLRLLLQGTPALARQRSPFGHRAMLLHYVAANGVEVRRQTVPRNAPEVARLLIDSGAPLHATCRAYGDDHTVLQLCESSAHPEAAGVRAQLERVLRGEPSTADRPANPWRQEIRRGFFLGLGFWGALVLIAIVANLLSWILGGGDTLSFD